MIISGNVQYTLKIADSIETASKKVLNIVNNVTQKTKIKVQFNLSGGVLNQKTGNLYRSVEENTFVINNNYTYLGQVGARGINKDFNYGAYWEGVSSYTPAHSPFPRQYEYPVFLDQSKEFLKELSKLQFI